jgi:hypothetical protein
MFAGLCHGPQNVPHQVGHTSEAGGFLSLVCHYTCCHQPKFVRTSHQRAFSNVSGNIFRKPCAARHIGRPGTGHGTAYPVQRRAVTCRDATASNIPRHKAFRSIERPRCVPDSLLIQAEGCDSDDMRAAKPVHRYGQVIQADAHHLGTAQSRPREATRQATI